MVLSALAIHEQVRSAHPHSLSSTTVKPEISTLWECYREAKRTVVTMAQRKIKVVSPRTLHEFKEAGRDVGKKKDQQTNGGFLHHALM